MRVLCMTPPYVKNFMRNGRWDVTGIVGGQWYPIYLAYCAGLLEKNGHEVKLLDAQVDGLTRDETYKIAQEFSPDMIVLYYSYKALENDLEIALILHNLTKAEIVLVGASASIKSVETLKKAKGVHALVRGEFDYPVLNMANKKEWHDIKGLIYKDIVGLTHVNPDSVPVSSEKLNEFPFVTDVYRRHLHLNNYTQADQFHPFVDMFTGRGCSWGLCSFCLFPNTINKGANYRTRKIENVMEELKFIKSEMPYIKEVFMQDDTLPAWRCNELSQAILDNHLKLTWSCYVRATVDMDLKTLKLMKQSGCRTMHVGYESANKDILKRMQKGISIETAEKFTWQAHKVGLFIVGDFLTGLPYESIESVKETVKWASKLPLQRYTFSLPKPYPETPLYDFLKESKNMDDNGHPNYPTFSAEEIRQWNKWSYRQVYLNPRYLMSMLSQPREWDRLVKSGLKAIPYFFSKKEDNNEW